MALKKRISNLCSSIAATKWLWILISISIVFVGWVYYTFSIGANHALLKTIPSTEQTSAISISNLVGLSGLITGLFSAAALGLAVWAIILQRSSIETSGNAQRAQTLASLLGDEIKELRTRQEKMLRSSELLRMLIRHHVFNHKFDRQPMVIDEDPDILSIRSAAIRNIWISLNT